MTLSVTGVLVNFLAGSIPNNSFILDTLKESTGTCVVVLLYPTELIPNFPWS